MFRAAITIAITLLFSAYTFACKYNPTARVDLDFSRYQGQWFLLETGPVRINETGALDCVYENYRQTSNPHYFNLDWHGQTTSGEIIIDSGIVTVPDSSHPGELDFYIDTGVFRSKVIATDYSSWTIEYTCNDELSWERFMLRSRTQTLPQAVRTTLHNIINGLGVSASDFYVVRHVNCY